MECNYLDFNKSSRPLNLIDFDYEHYKKKAVSCKPTFKQLCTLRYFVYNYNCKITVPDTKYNCTCLIDKIQSAINTGTITKRILDKELHYKVVLIDNTYTLCTISKAV